MSVKKEEANEDKNTNQRLFRSETDRVIAGVAGGLGDFFSIDPTIVRIIFVLLTVFGGSGILIYIVLWIIVPTESKVGLISHESIKENMAEMKDKAKTIAHNIHPQRTNNSRSWGALIIIILGFMFLSSNFGFFQTIEIDKFWPVILIGLGLYLFLRKK